MPRSRFLPRTSGTAGTVAIEYGLVLPAMLLLTLGTIDLGRLLWTDITLSRAADAGARCGAINANIANCFGCSAAVSIPDCAAKQASGATSIFTAGNFVASKAACGLELTNTNEKVVGTYTFTFLVPWFPQFGSTAPFGAPTLTLTATACYPLNH